MRFWQTCTFASENLIAKGLNKFMTFPIQFLMIMTLAINKVDGRGPSDTACCAHLAKKTKLMPY